MGTIAAAMFEDDAPIMQMDKLIQRIEASGGSRAAKWFDRAEKSFSKMSYQDALKDLDKVCMDLHRKLVAVCTVFCSLAALHVASYQWRSPT